MTDALQTSPTLEKLRRAARTHFVERGYHGTRPQDIAKTAGVANGTFYIHFSDKKFAFLDFAEQAQAELVEKFANGLSGISGTRNRWEAILRTLVNLSDEHAGLMLVAFVDPVFIAPDESKAWELYNRLGQLVQLAVDDSDSELPYNAELISHAMCGMLRDALVFAARRQIPQDELIDDLMRFIDEGLGLAKS